MNIETKGRVRPRRAARSVVLTISFIALVAPTAASAESTSSNAGMGIGSALASLIYGPTKIAYAVLGTVFGGMAWGLSGGDSEVADAVITPAIRGDYVVTPANLRGEPIEFIGRRQGYETEEIVMEDDLGSMY